jgi:hypothetical protein
MRCEKLWRERHQGITATGAEATLLERMRYKKPSRNKPLKANRLQRRNPMRYDGYSFIFSNDGFKSKCSYNFSTEAVRTAENSRPTGRMLREHSRQSDWSEPVADLCLFIHRDFRHRTR